MCVSIIELLRQLCSRVCWESWTDFQGLVSLYEHLLSPHEDANTSVQCNLLDIRAKLLSPGQDSYTRVLPDFKPLAMLLYVAFPVDGILRLLIALSGGEDGNTFGLKDIMRCEKKRFGGLNGMSGTDVVQEIKSLFQQTPLPLEDKSVSLKRHYCGQTVVEFYDNSYDFRTAKKKI
ncbi:hypothetical protein CCR75_007626 [Bremia lactucae]|uniref:Uncharacterized protein n=1 Tax=Bremia lactucae TaxID=4779 RepID=A0A976FF21_BRELC|nr:hypothetical protein CCR75_007626 [Bremia lactucae]